MEKYSLAELIKEGRESKGISQRELARQTGIDNNTISQIEKGERKKPNSLSLIKISQVISIPLNTLMTAAGYSKEDIDAAYMMNPAYAFGKENILNMMKRMEEIDEQIKRAKENIKKIKKEKKEHNDPTYANMTKKDITFFDKQYDELIKFYKLAIIAYEDQSKQLNNIISKATGAAMRATGIDVYEIDGEKID